MGVSGITEPERSDSVPEETTHQPYSPTLPQLTRLRSDPEDQQEDVEEEEPSTQPDNQTLLRLLEENEKVITIKILFRYWSILYFQVTYMFRCARIQGLDTTEGLLLFGQEHCYIVDGFTLMKNREIRDLDSVPLDTNEYEPILPNQGQPRRSRTIRQCSRFSYDDVR